MNSVIVMQMTFLNNKIVLVRHTDTYFALPKKSET